MIIDDHNEVEITAELADKLGDQCEGVANNLGDFHTWMLAKGKNPERKKGLSSSVANNYHSRVDQIYRFVIDMMAPLDREWITPNQADQFVMWLDEDKIRKQTNDNYSESGKRKFVNSLEKYFLWRHDSGYDSKKWQSRISFSQSHHESTDKLNFSERWKILEAALDYSSLPSFYDTDPDERERINGLVAQRLGKPKSEITSKDWERSDDSTKVGSLVATTLDTGLTPVEIGAARVDWFDPKRNVLTIPTEFASKKRPTSELPLTEETGSVFSKWIKERRHYEKYDGSNLIWLNREGNPYSSKSLCYLIRRLCDQVGIDHENRNIVWYSLRHNVGQSFEEEDSLSQAKDQLRHESIETTKKFYAGSTIESRRETLERINEKARRAATDPEYNPYADENKKTATSSRRSAPQRQSKNNDVHVDARIKNTPQARNQLAQDILAGEEPGGVDETNQ